MSTILRLFLAMGVTTLLACEQDAEGTFDAYVELPAPPPNECVPEDLEPEFCGSCCSKTACYTPTSGERCRPVQELEQDEIIHKLDSYGGSHICNRAGLFDPIASGGAAGDCCYVIGWQDRL